MKNKYILLLGIICCLLLSSCKEDIEDFLDKAPGVDITENTVFSSKVQLETFVVGTYRVGIHSIYAYSEGVNPVRNFTINAAMTDEAEAEVTFFHTNAWNTATILPATIAAQEDSRYTTRWTAIRNCNIILERIQEVPDLDDAYRNQVIGEVKFIRALNYSEMLKRYGGVPLVDKRFNLTDDFKVFRNTLAETVNFIVKDCDEAVALLPATYPANFRGRATKTAAQMLKSRVLLYAASPLFNTGQPYLDLGKDNNYICYGNADNARWQLAADAAKAAIDMAPTGNFSLVTNKGVDKNYKFVWEQNDNSEIVLADKLVGSRGRTQFPWYGIQPVSIVNAWGGVSVIHNFVRKYEKKDGTPQTWDMAGGSDLMKKYGELDPRFAQTVGYNGSFWNRDVPVLETFQGGRYAPDCWGGAWMKKLIPDVLSTASGATPNSMLFRLAEAHLNYAEALNEAKGPTPEAYNSVNLIRERSGMPKLPEGLTKEQFRERVRNERDLELAFEDHRFWDIRRWLIAEQEGVMKGKMFGLKIFKIANSTEFRYEIYTIETRTFLPKMYLHPFLENEVFKGYLVQNPGW